MRYALVRVPDDDAEPPGLIGWYRASAPRRYAVVVDPQAWAAWVREHAPDQLDTCGHVRPTFERAVRDAMADAGAWLDATTGELHHPTGIRLRTDGEVWLDVVTPAGHRWSSPGAVTPVRPSRHDGVAGILTGRDRVQASGV